ncbi:hypothetical protein FHT00_000356 [Sphingomonas insulae]|uniref:Uncharacterized protein n=1 Tax=Sphingomonas insulae TaxID=424800 RepID=A0ABN1HUX7_9SPHN|nr:hypothetical protein [Sphingomonas insulae]NIJ28428.1 hypothetical protein [Sphingomonas insulae]
MRADFLVSAPYVRALDLLMRALGTLDDLDEGVAAAQLSGVIDLVAARITEQSRCMH